MTPEPERAAAPPTLDEAYRAHAGEVWRLARLLGVRPEHVDDVVHETFLIVHRRLSHFDPQRPLKSWISGITRNVVLHYHRERARRERRLALVPAPEPDDAQPDEAVARAEAARAFEIFLDQLDQPKREVFVLFEVEDLSAKEIAQLTSTNINTVFTRLRAARQKFERFVAARKRTRNRDG